MLAFLENINSKQIKAIYSTIRDHYSTIGGRKLCIMNDQIDFCARCGSVLPLPSFLDTTSFVTCPICQLKVDAKYFNGIVSFTRIHFNVRDKLAKKNNQNEADGPVIERQCTKCGHDKQSFATLQTRSADEGQTIFYTCLKCGAKENENS